MSVLTEVGGLVTQRLALLDDDPEAAHGIMDDITERVVRAVAAGDASAPAAAVFAVALLDLEDTKKWRRWYA